MKLYFIRHGKTLGNLQGRYVGRTDEPLLPESIRELKQKTYPVVDFVIASPMVRCRQSAECLYPGVEMMLIEELREMDFGQFEYKNYQELNGNPCYQEYLDSGGQTTFPGAEPRLSFQERCLLGFRAGMSAATHRKAKAVALVVHGGTIMAILEAQGEPRRGYFDWQIKNAEMLEGETDGSGKIYIKG